tara:strand:+ start:149 stop:379 length:231 start_codon:yes stop_codon:yes gene_type:complete
MANQKQVLNTYTNVLTMLKENLSRDLLEAKSVGTIEVDNLNLQRVIALTTNLVDQYGANGYELLQKQTAPAKRTKK